MMAISPSSSALSFFQLPSEGSTATKLSISIPNNVWSISTTKQKASFELRSSSRSNVAPATSISKFEGLPVAPSDPILGVAELFNSDPNENKLNLGLGAYRTEDLQPYVLSVVKKAERRILAKGEDKEYTPIDGLGAFNKLTAELILGANNPTLQEQKVATVQAISGTGSLRLAAALIELYFPTAKVLISSPTWGNHQQILGDARVPWSEYRYYDPNTIGLDFEGMITDIKAAPTGSFVLLQGCAHNPTGIDPTPEQWKMIADIIQEKNHIPFFDVAYQGFASGNLDEDASSVRMFADRGMEMLVAQSYSKNLGLYAERIGALNVVCSSPDAASRVKGQLKRLAVSMYAFPPIHGARIVANVIGSSDLYDEWNQEIEMMSRRIKDVRKKLYDIMTSKDKSGKDWSFILEQNGMFSYFGLDKIQSETMTNKWHVYMAKGGRISLAGLPLAKCEYLADAIINTTTQNNTFNNDNGCYPAWPSRTRLGRNLTLI